MQFSLENNLNFITKARVYKGCLHTEIAVYVTCLY